MTNAGHAEFISASSRKKMSRQYHVYILASKRNGTLYIGVTNNLIKRVYEHKNHLIEGFTKQYKIHQLVHYELFDSAYNAISREKQLKNWRRQWKIALIEGDDWILGSSPRMTI